MAYPEQKVRIGIVGGAGYTGGELIRLLLHHPYAEIVFVHSKSNAGNFLYAIHSDLIGETDMVFSSQIREDVDVMFLCLGHGDSQKFLKENPIPDHVKVIDLSHDFRLSHNNISGNRIFTYGLPELQKEKIKQAQNIANPGCFATCIELALLPFAASKQLKSEVHISGITGSTGAGQSLSETSHFSWRNGNISAYKILGHQHLGEIQQSLQSLQPGFNKNLFFIPYRGNFTRGIMVTAYFSSPLALKDAEAMVQEFYQGHPFVHISKSNPSLKQVVNSNKCVLYLEKHGDTMVVISIIDNLLKGASGQAVQNMNLMFGLPETAGLKLKTVNF
jgi:N-acetyl-gamma-glutamyl-phosphate reductase